MSSNRTYFDCCVVKSMTQAQILRQNYCDVIAGGRNNAEHIARITRLFGRGAHFAFLLSKIYKDIYIYRMNILHIMHQFEHFRFLDMNALVRVENLKMSKRLRFTIMVKELLVKKV